MASQFLVRERSLILGSLIVLAVAAWVIVIWQASGMDTSMSAAMGGAGDSMSSSPSMASGATDSQASPTDQGMSDIGDKAQSQMTGASLGAESPAESQGMSMGLTMNMSAGLFLGVWVAMMVAMMFPTSAPMILTFAKIQETRQARGQVFVPTWTFVLAYIALWSATGLLAFVAASVAENLADNSDWLLTNAGRIGGAILVAAGLYQLSPWKNRCLAQCRTPTGFIMTRWKEGKGGAVRMGLEHGAYCLGCCWFLFVVLFPLGMMNVAAMALITVLIFAEKSLAIGKQVAQAAAVGLILYGSFVLLIMPGALPTSVTI